MKFVNATPHHYAAICGLVDSAEELFLISPSSQYPWDAKQLQTIANQRQHLTVGLIDNDIAAFANIYQLKPNDYCFIGNVIINKQFRNQGLGSQLMQHMMRICRETYHAEPRISVFADNRPALLMYDQLGFVPYAMETRENLDKENVVLIHMKHSKLKS